MSGRCPAPAAPTGRSCAPCRESRRGNRCGFRRSFSWNLRLAGAMPRHEPTDMRPHVEAVNPMQLGYQTTAALRPSISPRGGSNGPKTHRGTSIAGRRADRRTDAIAAKPPPHQVASSLVLQLQAPAPLLPETSTDLCSRDLGPIDFARLVQGGKRLGNHILAEPMTGEFRADVQRPITGRYAGPGDATGKAGVVLPARLGDLLHRRIGLCRVDTACSELEGKLLA